MDSWNLLSEPQNINLIAPTDFKPTPKSRQFTITMASDEEKGLKGRAGKPKVRTGCKTCKYVTLLQAMIAP
ncbi:MAG: hypothetical protein CL912_06915 [Deltaproteobacteria bacterium]|nr:hypothetical protein [Deltaproteobacteria bacterium]